MADTVTKEQRSKIMASVRGKETKPEIAIRKYLFSHGFRFRKNVKSLPGTPDIVLPKYKTVIFVHGCFWHGHLGCRYATVPKTRTEFWLSKIDANRARDAKKESALKDAGWKVLTVWQCEIKHILGQSKEDSDLIEAIVE